MTLSNTPYPARAAHFARVGGTLCSTNLPHRCVATYLGSRKMTRQVWCYSMGNISTAISRLLLRSASCLLPPLKRLPPITLRATTDATLLRTFLPRPSTATFPPTAALLYRYAPAARHCACAPSAILAPALAHAAVTHLFCRSIVK